MIDGHGDDMYRYGDIIRSNFSSNIPSRANHEELMAHLSACGKLISRYPEPEPRSLEREIAEWEGVEPENVIATNGATEAIYLLAHATEGCRSAILTPTFSEYEDACRMYGHRVIHVAEISELQQTDADVRWICNPNNPTGGVVETGSGQSGIIAVDASYSDYSIVETETAADFAGRPGGIRFSSLTKRFSIPGLRIGYAVGDRELIGRLRRLRMPWSVNALAIEAARWLMKHADRYAVDAIGLNNEAVRIAEMLNRMGIETAETCCNFVLAKLPGGLRAPDMKEYLAQRRGILIRDASNFHGLTPSHFRVAAQTREENDTLAEAIGEWMRLQEEEIEY